LTGLVNFFRTQGRTLWYLLLLLALSAFSLRAVQKSGAFRSERTRCNDFAVYYAASTALLDGGNPYIATSPEGRRYYYPPTFALVMAPASALGFDTAFVFYLLLQAAAFFILIHLSFRLLPDADRNPLFLLLLLVFLWRPFDSDFANGQINTTVVALAFLGLYLIFVSQKTVGGALLLGLSVAFKLYTAPLTLLLLFKKQKCAFLWTVLGAAFLIVVFPALFVGLERNSVLLGSFYGRLCSPYVRGGAPEVWKASGQSFWAAMQRFFTRTDAASHYHRPVFVNIAELPPSLLWWLYIAVSALLLLFILMRCREEPFYLGVALLFCVTPLVLPLARKAFFVLLTPSFLTAVSMMAELRRRRSPQRRKTLMLVLFFVSWLLMVFTSRSILGKEVSTIMLALSCFTFGTVALLSVLLLGAELLRGQGGEDGETAGHLEKST